MKKVDKILEWRFFRKRSKPYKIFEKRLSETFQLYKFIEKLEPPVPKKVVYQARCQYLVSLVTCFETFCQDIVKLMIDDNLLDIEQVLKLKKIRDLRFSLKEIEQFQKNKVKISEIVCNEINFQNFEELHRILSLIEFESNCEKVIEKISKKELLKDYQKEDKFLRELMDFIRKRKGKVSKSDPKFRLQVHKFMIDSFSKWLLTNKNERIHDKQRIFKIVEFAILLRHKVVHNDAKLDMSEEEAWSFTIAIFLFCTYLQEVVNILKAQKN